MQYQKKRTSWNYLVSTFQSKKWWSLCTYVFSCEVLFDPVFLKSHHSRFFLNSWYLHFTSFSYSDTICGKYEKKLLRHLNKKRNWNINIMIWKWFYFRLFFRSWYLHFTSFQIQSVESMRKNSSGIWWWIMMIWKDLWRMKQSHLCLPLESHFNRSLMW